MKKPSKKLIKEWNKLNFEYRKTEYGFSFVAIFPINYSSAQFKRVIKIAFETQENRNYYYTSSRLYSLDFSEFAPEDCYVEMDFQILINKTLNELKWLKEQKKQTKESFFKRIFFKNKKSGGKK